MALSLVDELLDRDLSDFDEDLLECDFFPNEDRLDSLSSDSFPLLQPVVHLVFEGTQVFI